MRNTTCQGGNCCPSPVVRTIAGDGMCVRHYQRIRWPIMRKVAYNGGVNPNTGGTMYPPIPFDQPIGIGRFVAPAPPHPEHGFLRCDECSGEWVGDWLGEVCPDCVRRGQLWT